MVALLAVRDRVVQIVAAILLVLCLTRQIVHRKYNCFRMHLLAADDINECLVMEGLVAGKSCLLMIDTGYAGPPVLSMSYLSLDDEDDDVKVRYTRIMKRLRKGVSAEDQNRGVDEFIRRSGCMAYTSGCTMRLMGIGSTQEQQADMLMCDMLQLRTASGSYGSPKRATSNAHADVFVTNPLPSSVHIITCDFLLHSSPSLLEISSNTLRLNMSVQEEVVCKAGMTMLPMVLSGGSFVVDLILGGVSFKCTVDTGSPGPICLSSRAAARLTRCNQNREGRVLRQSGVNGEDICSEIVSASLEFCHKTFQDVPIFANDMNTDQVDGYVGLAVLRAFDILITPAGIGFRPNRHEMLTVDAFRSAAAVGSCPGVTLSCEA